MLSIVSTLSSSVPWLAVNEHAPEAVSWDWNAVGTVSLVTDGSRSLGRSDAATQKSRARSSLSRTQDTGPEEPAGRRYFLR